MKLTTRLILAIVLITTGCLVLFSSYQYISTQNRLYQSITDRLDADVEFLKASIVQPLFDYNDKGINYCLLAAMNNETILSIIVLGAGLETNQPLYGYYREQDKSIVQGFVSVTEEEMLIRNIELLYVDEFIGTIKITASVRKVKEHLLRVLAGELLRIFILNILLIGFLIVVVRLKIVKPILSLTAVAQELAQGNLRKEIPKVSVKEVAELGNSIDILRKSILSKIGILEEKNSELLTNEKNLSTTLNSIGDAVIATDELGQVVRMNPVAEKLTGWTLADAKGRKLPDVFVIRNALTGELCENPVDIVLKTESIVGLANHTVLISKDETEYHIADSGAPIRDDSGAVNGVVLVFRDVSNEYKLEEQLRQSQKLEAVGQLAGGVAHDFNNALGGIMGATELLEKYLIDDPKARKYRQMILDSSTRAADLTSNLLTFSRSNPPVSSIIDVHGIIEETISLLKKTIDRRINLVYEPRATNSKIVGDPAHLQSAFLNMCINASHAMPSGGSLEIVTKNIEIDETFCQLTPFKIQSGSHIQVEFMDTGHGIKQEHLTKIFDPFFTTKAQGKGTGLGLASVYGTIKHHQGSITVYSEVGKGTSFSILLPVSQEENKVSKEPQILKKGIGRILLVDDEEIMRLTAQAILQDLGYEVLLADDGKQALRVFQEQGYQIDLVILDMVMPNMNGSDCFKALQEIDHNVRVILSSGFSREENVEEMKNNGLAGFIRKPYRSADLSQIVFDTLKQ